MTRMPRLNFIKIVSFFLAALYASFLFSFPDDFFRDRANYVVYAASNLDVFSIYDGFSAYFNEPLFLLYNYFVSFFIEPEVVPRFTVFIIAFTFFYFVSIKSKNTLVFFVSVIAIFFVGFLFHQQLVVLRQGLATAILLWVVFYTQDKRRILMAIFILGFVHSSFFILFFVFLCERVFSLYIKDVRVRLFLLLLVILIGSAFMLKVAGYLGVRQATEGHLLNNTSGIGGFLLFSFLLGFMFLRGIKTIYGSIYGYFSLIGFLIYLGFYFTVPISGRVIGTFLPFYLMYVVSDFNSRTFYPFVIFLTVNVFIFVSMVTSGSLTYEGAVYLNRLLGA